MTLKPGRWSFTRWTTVGQLEAMEVHHPLFSARLFLQGAHLTHFAAHDEPSWLWMSDTARFKPGVAIRGGIPVCWPWFGVPDKNPPEVRRRLLTTSSHGFARTAVWELEDVSETAHDVEISLSLDANSDFSDLWSGCARLLMTFHFSADGCQLALTTSNPGAEPLAFTQALHTYLPTPDVSKTLVRGLENCGYVDSLKDWSYFTQQGPVSFQGETDRIYENGDSLMIETPTGKRRITAIGSDSTVIWNPGPGKAARLSDFPNLAWKSMLCVESANALGDYRVLNSGQSHTLGVMIRKG